MKIYIKNMVSRRCKTVVQMELQALGLEHKMAEMGEIYFPTSLTNDQEFNLKASLQQHGLEVLDDPKNILAHKVQNVIIELVHNLEERVVKNYSVYISEKLKYDYTYLASVFSESTGVTIEQCIISHKIERVKELLLFQKLTLTAISKMLHYSSAAHLATQFKKVTGFTTSQFKKQKPTRISVEEVCGFRN